MANVKKYRVDYDGGVAGITVEIDHDIMTEPALHEINNFWLDAEYRLANAKGDILMAVLVFLAQTSLIVQLEGDYNINGLIKRFDYDDPYLSGGIEGWPKMDGSAGIKIVRLDQHVFYHNDFNVKEVA
ncbi:MAG: hypothetical protein C0622_05195 [Desulfuromonas sp.]|nr:MAG: hypothetical protein C0622_05195 [Desulfuromonas sp.]